MEISKPIAHTSSEVNSSGGNSSHNQQEMLGEVIKTEPISETDEIGYHIKCEALKTEIDIVDETLGSNNEEIVGEGVIKEEITDNSIPKAGYKGIIYKGTQLTMEMEKFDLEPYICEYCGRIFLLNTGLRTYVNEHIKGKYQCNICVKLFSRRVQIMRHLMENSCRKNGSISKLHRKGYII